MSAEIRIYVADLAAYNNGKLHGVWIDATDRSLTIFKSKLIRCWTKALKGLRKNMPFMIMKVLPVTALENMKASKQPTKSPVLSKNAQQ